MSPCGVITGLDAFCGSSPLPPISSALSLSHFPYHFLRLWLLTAAFVSFCQSLVTNCVILVSLFCFSPENSSSSPTPSSPSAVVSSSLSFPTFTPSMWWVGAGYKAHFWQPTATNYCIWWQNQGFDNAEMVQIVWISFLLHYFRSSSKVFWNIWHAK